MALSTKLELRQGQQLVMTPQLQQAIRLLQLSNIELMQYVETELERNPLLERDETVESGPRSEVEPAEYAKSEESVPRLTQGRTSLRTRRLMMPGSISTSRPRTRPAPMTPTLPTFTPMLRPPTLAAAIKVHPAGPRCISAIQVPTMTSTSKPSSPMTSRCVNISASSCRSFSRIPRNASSGTISSTSSTKPGTCPQTWAR